MHVRAGLLALFGSASWPLARAALYTDPSALPQTTYDFVIVGAGTAGLVVANRLTESSDWSVLVIEAGISNTVDTSDEIPFICTSLSPDTLLDWNYTTTAQSGLNGRTVAYPRGRVLGGSSTINFMVWTRGSVDDWDRYAAVTGDSGWSWNEMLPYMEKSESLVPPGDGHNTTGEVNPAVHGTDGPISISLPGYPIPITPRVLETTQELPETFAYVEDMNAGYPLGLGWSQGAVTTDGRRSSSATGYLDPVLNRTNLDVLIDTTVTKLVPANADASTLSFTTVEIAQSNTSQTYTVSANKEVILSAGAIATPQILMLSGIGDSSSLSSLGITPLVNLSNVGQNLADHPLIANHWLVNSTDTYEEVSRNATYQEELLVEWESGDGLFINDGTVQIAWTRIPSNSTIWSKYTDPSAGPASPHIEIVPANGYTSFLESTPSTGNYFTFVTNGVSPASRGSVTLASSDPFDSPLIDPGFLSDPFDLYMMAEGVLDNFEFLTASAWDGYIISPVAELEAAIQSEATLEAYIRNYTTTVFHPVATARMWAEDSDDGVVTPNLLVRNTTGLRVVDASVLPYLPAAHPQAAIYAVAERASDLIKDTWSSSNRRHPHGGF